MELRNKGRNRRGLKNGLITKGSDRFTDGRTPGGTRTLSWDRTKDKKSMNKYKFLFGKGRAEASLRARGWAPKIPKVRAG